MGMLNVMGSEMVNRQAELNCLKLLYYTAPANDIAFDARKSRGLQRKTAFLAVSVHRKACYWPHSDQKHSYKNVRMPS